MATRAKVNKVAAAHGAELDIDNDFQTIHCWLPKGRWWSATGCRLIHIAWRGSPMGDLYDEAINQMNDGTFEPINP